MWFNCIHLKIKNRNYTDLNNNKILKLYKLSIGNYINNSKYPFKSNEYYLDNRSIFKIKNLLYQEYNKNKKSPIKNIEISNKNKFIKRNIAKMVYKIDENMKEKQLFNKIFLRYNMKRTKVIMNNK